jgi:pimeloyl-ACP methyl ester carboxylesterase
MKVFMFLTSAIMAAVVGLQAAAIESDVLTIAKNHKVYYRYHQAERGQPTVVMLNGLIYSLDNWNKYVDLMTDKGYGVLLIAYSAQPESLSQLKVAPFFSEIEMTVQGPHEKGLTTQDLVDEVMATVDHLDIDRFNVLSLSYSSVVASQLAEQQKDRIDNLILVAPAVMAAHRYNSWGQMRHAWYSSIRPTGDYYYDAELYSTMSLLITPDKYSFTGVQFRDFFDGVFHMGGSSAKYFDLKDYAKVELPPTHLLLASNEDAPLLADQRKFWELMKNNPARGSYTFFQGGQHALPGTSPEETAEITSEILSGERTGGFERVTVKDDGGVPGGSTSDSGQSDGWFSSLSK